MKGTSKLLVFSIIAIVVLASSIAFLGSARADTPTTPESYYGTLTINGAPAPVGTGVKAMMDGVNRTYNGPYSTTVEGQYGSTTISGKFKVDGTYADNGKTIIFMVETSPGSGAYVAADQTSTFNPGRDTNLNLTADFEEGCTEGETRSCYTGDPATEGVGICHAGTESCVGGVWSGECVGEVTPTAETCDGADNNCDGTTDETWETELGTTCSDGVGECYAEGLIVCNAEGTGTECSAVAGTPSEETCDGLDNDCDTEVDEGLGSTTCGMGVCENTVENCVGGVPQTCESLDVATAENCTDGLDNDCDGYTDCIDSDCFSDEACAAPTEYCIEIESIKILDGNFNEVTEIEAGHMYNVEVVNTNTCEDPIQSMQIIEIMEGSTPTNIGTLTATLDAGETSTMTVGFVMPLDAVAGTEYTAKAFNWNHWIDQDPETHEMLSESAETTFTVSE